MTTLSEEVSLLPWPVVAGRVGLSRTAAWRLYSADPPRFPRPVQVGGRALWRSDAVTRWIEEVSFGPPSSVDRAAKARQVLAERRASRTARGRR